MACWLILGLIWTNYAREANIVGGYPLTLHLWVSVYLFLILMALNWVGVKGNGSLRLSIAGLLSRFAFAILMAILLYHLILLLFPLEMQSAYTIGIIIFSGLVILNFIGVPVALVWLLPTRPKGSE